MKWAGDFVFRRELCRTSDFARRNSSFLPCIRQYPTYVSTPSARALEHHAQQARQAPFEFELRGCAVREMSHTAEKKRKVQPKIGSIFAAVTCAEMDSKQKHSARLAKGSRDRRRRRRDRPAPPRRSCSIPDSARTRRWQVNRCPSFVFARLAAPVVPGRSSRVAPSWLRQ